MTSSFQSRQPKSKKLGYLGHRPKGVPEKDTSNDKLKKRASRVVKAYQKGTKLSNVKGVAAVLDEDNKRRADRVAKVRRRMLRGSRFSLNDTEGLDDDEVGAPVSEEKKVWHKAFLDLLAKEPEDDNISVAESSDDELDYNQTHARFESGEIRKRKREDEEKEISPKKAKKQAMSELIAKQKAQKAEQAKAQYIQNEMLNVLDEQYNEIRDSLDVRKPGEEIVGEGIIDYRSQKQIQIEEDFDRLVGLLRTDARGVAAERVKTPAELAREKAAKLEKIEQERQAKLRAVADSTEDLSDSGGDDDDDQNGSSDLDEDSDDEGQNGHSDAELEEDDD
eukprot:Blabericola_migrator_1__5583@NODE_283_length_10404_cov_699_850924_g233_i0_p4_GENE_NODE_283_length_10404_cov_699_850924_g233_i0NODE_283_length_10404_cov_699_850924_g233_i0_p4_ORF_typecomplete_len335_score103_53Nop14/PF04147_12/8_7e30_NODE_283_length_10404_cov_699_850924_g233_i051416145